ncbi:alpha-amylase family glycosyl hydrolase [Candidatus Leptofilum sp.]|uniref:alpha-amylase family glycosyl hydrolase n=1 Tax=Candidatus Leptofilum sp. TaxID=3241576 RepID=UPI003B5C9244
MKTYHPHGTENPKWWQTAVFYQIYPRSFQDSNGDGIGDLQGIINRLDYLVDLGIDAIWISPIFPSPMADFGYDVSDYCDIHPVFGNLETFDRLLAEAHACNLKIILDFVPNHSSNQHPWFLASRSSRDNAKRDWYIWRDTKPDGSPPNNWTSMFGGPAWTWDEKTQQYYMHSFLPEQPDLNWRNPEVVDAMHNVLRFWLKRGVDGFRVDAILCLIKHEAFLDNPPVEAGSYWEKWGHQFEPRYTVNQPEMFEHVRKMRHVFDEFDERVHIGETSTVDVAGLLPYYGQPLDGYDIPFNFKLLHADWNATEMRAIIEEYYDILPTGGWPNFVFGNHDIHRFATRYGRANHRSVAMLLLTLWGIPTLYYGDELGMEDVFIPVEQRIDPWGIDVPESDFGRDPERTPMQWDASLNAGFTSGTPWLPLAQNYAQVNVADQLSDDQSTLTFYKTLLHLRRSHPALHNGSFTFVDGLGNDLLAYLREAGSQRLLVCLNFGTQPRTVILNHLTLDCQTLLSTHFNAHTGTTLSLQAHESVLLQLK